MSEWEYRCDCCRIHFATLAAWDGHECMHHKSQVASPAERSRAYRDRKRGSAPREPKPHGTVAAYRRHQRAQEAPCEACKAAHAAYQRELYKRRRSR